jgi:hypothetical protein
MGAEVYRDLFDVAFALAALSLLGAPLARLLPEPTHTFERVAAAPVLGFGAGALLTTVLYRWGVPPAVTLACAAVVGLAARRWSPRRAPSRGAGREVAIVFAATSLVLLLALAPKWSGGAQFTIFQGNQLDQRNYVASALSYSQISYADLARREAGFDSGFAQFGARNLAYRPAVALMFAGLGRFWPGRLTEQPYIYMALLTALWFLAGVLVAARLLGATAGRAVLLAGGLALGFFSQYVLDINAWSEFAALPLALVGLVALNATLAATIESASARRRAALLLAVTCAALAYLYPEALPPYLFCAALAWGTWLFARRREPGARHAVLAVAFAALGALALCALYWYGTLGFLWGQAADSALHAPPQYYRFFQRYLWGLDAGDAPGTLYDLVSPPIDFVAGASGLYMLGLPAAGLGSPWKLIWKLGEGLGLACLVGAACAAGWRALLARDTRSAFVTATLVALAVPIVPALMGRYWLAGKLLSMVAPLLFFLLVLPLLETAGERRRLGRLPASLYVAGQIAFGLARPVYAAQPDGIHYTWPPYPSIRGAFLKTDYSWDFRERLAALADCRHVRLDVGERLLETYAEMALQDHGQAWSSSRPIRAFDTEAVLAPGARGHDDRPDCLLTDAPDSARSRLRVASLRRAMAPAQAQDP